MVDPVVDLLRLKDERSYSGVREALRGLQPHSADAAIIGVMHAHRERDMRSHSVSTYYGSVGFGSACDLLLDYKTLKADPTQRLLRVSKSRCRAAQKQGTEYYLEFDGTGFEEVEPEPEPERVPRKQAPSPENSWRVPIPVQTQEPPCGTSAVLTTTCATTEALA